jgi:hypothetical protein
MYPP